MINIKGWIYAGVLCALVVMGFTIQHLWSKNETLTAANAQLEADKKAAIKQRATDDEVINNLTAANALLGANQKVVTNEVIKYVQNPATGKCVIPADFVRIANRAAVPEATSKPSDSSPSASDDRVVLQSLTENYKTCNAIRAQCNALIEWHHKSDQ